MAGELNSDPVITGELNSGLVLRCTATPRVRAYTRATTQNWYQMVGTKKPRSLAAPGLGLGVVRLPEGVHRQLELHGIGINIAAIL